MAKKSARAGWVVSPLRAVRPTLGVRREVGPPRFSGCGLAAKEAQNLFAAFRHADAGIGAKV